MRFLIVLIFKLAFFTFTAESKFTYKGRRALPEDEDAAGYGGKKVIGYDADGVVYGGKKAGYVAAYGGKKVDADGVSYGGKKIGYDVDGAASYGGKKAGYDFDGSYGGKKSGGYDCNDEEDDDSSDGGKYSGKKGGSEGKQGGCFDLRDDDCEICGATKWMKPKFLKLRYISSGAESFYQSRSVSTCEDKLYSSPTKVLVSGHGTYELEDGDEFLVEPSSGFSAVTEFCFNDEFCCTFHTSCSEPIVAGDQFGPFQILAGNDCKNDDPPTPNPINPQTRLPTPEPTRPPTSEPTMEPTPEPTRPPTPEPTSPPTPEPTSPRTLPCITGNVRIDDGNTVVDVEFNYPTLEPVPSDWVGLYPCDDANLDPPYNKEPFLWVYTCYSRVCRFEDRSTATGIGSFTIDDRTLPSYGSTATYKSLGKILTDQPGCYKILLNRIDGDSPPPYYGICEGNEIELTTSIIRNDSTPSPVNPTPAPVNPTPLPVNPTTAKVNPSLADACEVPSGGCSVCGEGKFVSAPDEIFIFPGSPFIPCGSLETAGLNGMISFDQCEFLPRYTTSFCSCKDCLSMS